MVTNLFSLKPPLPVTKLYAPLAISDSRLGTTALQDTLNIRLGDTFALVRVNPYHLLCVYGNYTSITTQYLSSYISLFIQMHQKGLIISHYCEIWFSFGFVLLDAKYLRLHSVSRSCSVSFSFKGCICFFLYMQKP